MKRPLFVFFLFLLLCSSSFALVRWSLSATDTVNDNPLMIGDEAVFTSYDGRVYAVRADTGTLAWNYGAGDKITLDAQALDTDTVAALTSTGKLVFLRASDGRLELEKPFGKPPVSFAAGEGRAFVGFAGSIAAVDGTGKALWNKDLPGSMGPIGHGNGRLYFTSSGKLYSVGAENGTIYWTADAEDSFLSKPVEYGESVYFGATNGKLYVFDRSSGVPKWNFKTNGWVTSTPRVTDDAVYFSSNDDYFYAVSHAGRQIFKLKIGSGGWAQPETYQGRGGTIVVFGANDGKLYGIGTKTGNVVWSFSPYGKPGSPRIYKGDLVFGTSKGRIYSLSPSPICSFSWPNPLDVVGNWPAEIEGKASSDDAIQKVDVRTTNGEWVEAFGEETWIATIDFSKVAAGTVDLECRATDIAGRAETGDYSSITLVKSDTAQPQKMYVFYPFEVMPQENFTLSVKDSRGVDLRKLKVTVSGEEKSGSSPFRLTLGKLGDAAITIEKPGFETVKVTVKAKGDNTLMLAIGGILLVAVAGYFLFGKKMLAKKQ